MVGQTAEPIMKSKRKPRDILIYKEQTNIYTPFYVKSHDVHHIIELCQCIGCTVPQFRNVSPKHFLLRLLQLAQAPQQTHLEISTQIACICADRAGHKAWFTLAV